MTQQHLIELIQEARPEKGEAYLRILLNQALREFCENTQLQEGESTVTSVADQSAYPLPSDCIDVLSVSDSEGVVLHRRWPQEAVHLDAGEALWWIEADELLLGYVSENTGSRAVISTLEAGEVYTVKYTRYSTALTSANLTSEIDLPAAFHPALEARVMERLSPIEERSYWYARWRDMLSKGKAWKNRHRTGGGYTVTIHEM